MLGHDHLLGELVPQLRDMGDDADHPAADSQPVEGLGDQRECVGIEGAEALVDEQAVEIHRADGTLNLVAELQGESQRGQKGFSAAQRVADPRFVRVVVIDDPDLVVLEPQGVRSWVKSISRAEAPSTSSVNTSSRMYAWNLSLRRSAARSS